MVKYKIIAPYLTDEKALTVITKETGIAMRAISDIWTWFNKSKTKRRKRKGKYKGRKRKYYADTTGKD